MSKFSRCGLMWWLVVILFFGLLGAPAMVRADGGNPSLIHACVNSNALARIVGPNDACRRSETPVHWAIGEVGPAAGTVNCNAGQTITQALQTPGTPLT